MQNQVCLYCRTSTDRQSKGLESQERALVEFVSVSEQIDTSTSIGKAVYTIISAISTLERDLISERVLSGLENAKADGKTLGRPISRRSKLIRALHEKGYSYREIGGLAGCSPSTAHGEIMGSKKKDS